MSKTPAPTPQLNRLRAAAALIPIIQSGLANAKLSPERAAQMTQFVEWTTHCTPEDATEQALVEEVAMGLHNLKSKLES
jgi:hypothetical protein